MNIKTTRGKTIQFCLIFALFFSSLAPIFTPRVQAAEPQTEEVVSEVTLLEQPFLDETEVIPEESTEKPNSDSVDLNLFDVLPKEEVKETEEEEPELYLNHDEVKSLSEKLNIEEDSVTGAFIYNYPIQTPVGRNGMHPSLNLVYNNQDNNNQSLFGYGFSLNIPYISRINKKGIDNLYSENYFSSSLSGELVVTDLDNGLYGSKVQSGNFISYQYSSSTDIWIAKDKFGTVYTFGPTIDSRQDDPNDSSQVYKWMLQETRDTNDNFVRYEYYKDSGQIYPDKIFYTGHDSTDGIFEVEFLRESRNDNFLSMQTGFEVINNYRISEIIIKVNNEWVKKYNISYIYESDTEVSYIDAITESGRDDSGNISTLPYNDFNYQARSRNWTLDANWELPMPMINTDYGDIGVRLVDVNGDSLIDIVKSFYGPHDGNNGVYINDGTDWILDTNWTIPLYIRDSRWDYRGSEARFVDVNSDGLPDLIRYHNITDPVGGYVYINNGTGWILDTNWVLPTSLTSTNGDKGTRFADVNNDGLVDVLSGVDSDIDINKVYIHNGTGWTLDTNWTLPELFINTAGRGLGTRLVDINGDGLIDIIRAWDDPDTDINRVHINNGTGWTLDTNWTLPVLIVHFDYGDEGVRLVDVNSDGFVDIAKGQEGGSNDIYINDGTGWTLDSNWILPESFVDYTRSDLGTRLLDIDNDGLVDVVRSWKDWSQQEQENNLYIKNGDAKFLVEINGYKGSKIDMDYQTSTKYLDTGGDLSNPDLSLVLHTVKQIDIDDGLGNQQIIDYHYSDGEQFFDTNNIYDKKFAGFGKIEKNIEDRKSITYYHQGNDTNSSNGETEDSYYKIGKPYRVEIYDDSTEDLFQQIVNKWDEYDLGNDQKFVYNSTSTQADLTDTTKSTAVVYDYDMTNGNLETEHNLGEVVINASTGVVTDILSGDEKDTEYEYAVNATDHILAAPKTKTISDTSDNKEQDLYYDELPHGQVEKVNLTKEDFIEDGVELNRTFNDYGLVMTEIDPEFNTTTIWYNSSNLYPTSTINALGHVTQTDYNLFNGQVATSTDPNGLVTVNKFDAFGRLIQTKISDPDNPNDLLTKQEITYYDDIPRGFYNTGWQSPSQTGYYYNQFIDPTNAYESDNQYAYAHDQGGGGSERWQSYEGFDFNIPANSEIVGIEVLAEHKVDDETNVNESLAIYLDSLSNWSLSEYLTVSETDHIDVIGGEDYLWGVEPVVSDFDNNNFSIYYQGARVGGGDTTWFLDNIQAKIYYENYEVNFFRYTEVKDYFSPSQYRISREYYDGLDRLIQKKSQTATSNEWSTVDISYDSQGRVERQSLPYISNSLDYSEADLQQPDTIYTYDVLDRVLTETTAVGTTTYEYDGFTTTIIDANNNQKDLTKDAHGNLVEVKEYNDTEIYTTDYEYSLTNKLEKITDHEGHVRNFVYDDLDNLTSQDMVHHTTNPNPATISYDHDKNGNVITQNGFRSLITNYIYDELNRPTTEKQGFIPKIDYTYDQGDYGKGRLTFADYQDDDSKAYEYDILGRVTTATTTINTVDYVLKYEYNLDNNLTKVIYPNDYEVNYYYNDIGQIEEVELDDTSATSTIAENVEYNANGQMVYFERGNGVDTEYFYDPADNYRLIHTTSTKDTTVLQDIEYTYDDVGNITQIDDDSGTALAKMVSYEYDDLYRLTTSTVDYNSPFITDYTRHYEYDPIGNMTYNSATSTYSYDNDNPHQLSSVGDVDYTYDNAGNMTYDDYRNYTWDWRDRMKSSYISGTNSTDYYLYDHNNQRFLKYNKTKIWIPPDPTGLGDGMEEEGGDGPESVGYWITVLKHYKYIDKYYQEEPRDTTKAHIYLNGIKLASINNTDDPYYILGDHINSSNILVDSNGTVAELTDYNPYGDIYYENTITKLNNEYKFSSKEVDEETDLQYFGARYYDNVLGRFTSIDAWDGNLTDPQSFNKYAYSRNNPVVFVDPSGNQPSPFFDQYIAPTINNLTDMVYNKVAKPVERAGWYVVSNLGGIAMLDNSSELLQHSLQDNPEDLYFDDTSSYESSEITSEIKGNKDYQDYVDEVVGSIDARGGTDFSFNSNEDSGLNLRFNFFSSPDLFLGLHNVETTINGERVDEGHQSYWDLNVQLNDRYDFRHSGYNSPTYLINEPAYQSQERGAITPYNIQINFQDQWYPNN